jgi:hypothetical protein
MSISGKVYKLISNNTDDIYIGSTVQKISSRKAGHKKDYKNFLNGKRQGGCMSFKIIEQGDVDIILLENVICNSITELKDRERYWIENTLCINKNIPNQTRKEWYQKNKELYSIKNKEWRTNNPDYFKEYQKRNKAPTP